jgi:hypothetical protein
MGMVGVQMTDLVEMVDEGVMGMVGPVDWRWGRGWGTWGVLVVNCQTHVSPHLSLGLPASKVPFCEVVDVGGMNSPVVTFPIRRPPRLDEAVIEREVVSDGIPPSWTPGPEVGVVVENVLVNVTEDELLVGGAEYSHGNETNVAMLGLGLVGRTAHGETRVNPTVRAVEEGGEVWSETGGKGWEEAGGTA